MTCKIGSAPNPDVPVHQKTCSALKRCLPIVTKTFFESSLRNIRPVESSYSLKYTGNSNLDNLKKGFLSNQEQYYYLSLVKISVLNSKVKTT